MLPLAPIPTVLFQVLDIWLVLSDCPSSYTLSFHCLCSGVEFFE